MNTTKVPAFAEKLADEEARQIQTEAKKRLDRLAKVTADIEKVLIENKCSWLDWNEVVQRFNERNSVVIPQIQMSEIKTRFEDIVKNKQK